MKSLRAWATPMVIGGFTLMAVTGVLMFFHIDTGLNKLVHEWAGWLMIAGVIAHVTLNVRPFMNYLKKPMPIAVMSAFAVALALSFVPAGQADGPRGLPPGMSASVSIATIDELIALSGAQSGQAYSVLASAGFDAMPGETLGAVAGDDATRQAEVLELLFGS